MYGLFIQSPHLCAFYYHGQGTSATMPTTPSCHILEVRPVSPFFLSPFTKTFLTTEQQMIVMIYMNPLSTSQIDACSESINK